MSTSSAESSQGAKRAFGMLNQIASTPIEPMPVYVIRVEYPVQDLYITYSIPSDVMKRDYKEALVELETLPPFRMVQVGDDKHGAKYKHLCKLIEWGNTDEEDDIISPLEKAGYRLGSHEDPHAVIRNIVALYSIYGQ